MNPLTASDCAQFIERGWCLLPGAFSQAQAIAAQEVVWQRMWAKRGIARADPTTWPAAYDVEESLDASPQVIDCFTPAIGHAIEQIVGAGRWCGVPRWGFWPVSFSYAKDEPAPYPQWGWHIDGNWFRHTLDCPKQGLLVIGLFTDVPPNSGGTVVAEGSHRRTARVLADHPEGLSHRELFDLVLAQPIGNFRELTGSAGDVVLAHPFLFHTRGCKRHGPPRILSNVEAPLREPMCFERADGSHSVLEDSIRLALDQSDGPMSCPQRCRF
jgi:hypothetical protein